MNALNSIDEHTISFLVKHKSSLLESVNNKFLKRDDLEALIGGMHNLQMMLENHRNHIDFVIMVFKIGNADLLFKTLPWVYRSYHSQGFSYDYFSKELNLWRETLEEMTDYRDLGPVISIYDKMIGLHTHNVRNSEDFQSQWDLSTLTTEQRDFCDSLIQGNQHRVFAIADRFNEKNGNLREFYMELVAPAMFTIGHYWESGSISVAEEHLASSIISRVMGSKIDQHLPEKPPKGKIIVCASANEYHEIGARMTANVFEDEGWDVTYLGANTPIRDLESFMMRLKPTFLGLSVTMVFNLDSVKELIHRIKANKELSATKIILGGSLFQSYPELKSFVEADFFATGFADALEYAERHRGQ